MRYYSYFAVNYLKGTAMSQSSLTESQLHLAVEQLRSQHSNTIDLYKAVASLLFFQYDSTPTTNRMYQLVRKGSMGAPAEALKLFWKELRDRSQVRMEQADIPAALKQSAGMLVAQLWEESVSQALQTTEQANQTIYVQLAAAEKKQQEAIETIDTLQSALLIAQQQLQQQDEKIEGLQLSVQKEQLHSATLQQQLHLQQEQKQEMLLQHEKALLAQKEQISLSEQRAADMEKYARLEIERTRQESAKTQQQDQQRFSSLQQKFQETQQQYQEHQKSYVELQQQYRYQQNVLEQATKQHQLIEQKNQDLHALLQQLQQQLTQSGSSSRSSLRQAPSRLAKQRAQKNR